eukprot:4984732-Pleurochrysis_carterae.AAC.5
MDVARKGDIDLARKRKSGAGTNRQIKFGAKQAIVIGVNWRTEWSAKGRIGYGGAGIIRFYDERDA